MTTEPQADRDKDLKTASKKAWVAPAISRIRAGEAEVGTRHNTDGSFTAS